MDVIRRVRLCLDLNLVRDVKGNKNFFCKYTSSRRSTRENVVSWLNEQGMWKRLRFCRPPLLLSLLAKTFRNCGTQGKVWSREDVRLVEEV